LSAPPTLRASTPTPPSCSTSGSEASAGRCLGGGGDVAPPTSSHPMHTPSFCCPQQLPHNPAGWWGWGSGGKPGHLARRPRGQRCRCRGLCGDEREVAAGTLQPLLALLPAPRGRGFVPCKQGRTPGWCPGELSWGGGGSCTGCCQFYGAGSPHATPTPTPLPTIAPFVWGRWMHARCSHHGLRLRKRVELLLYCPL
jgi:hypothetical protein